MHDPRNEVFLSALDLFTLLLFAFVGVWRATEAAGATDTLAMPLAGGVPTVRPTTTTVEITEKGSPRVQWAASSVGGSDGATCDLLYRDPADGDSDETFHVPCWPAAFSAAALPLDQALQRRGGGKATLAICPPAEVGLEACARLVLVAREHNLDAAMLVQKAASPGEQP